MNRRIGKSAVAIMIALGVGLVGASAASAGSKPPNAQDYFKKLKKVQEPNPCKNDPGVTDTEIKVGALLPQSGAAAAIGPALDGFKARIAMANENGEFGKRKVVIVTQDDKGDTATNASGAQKLVEDEKVFAVFEATQAAAASAPYLWDKQVPVVGWALGLPTWGTYPNMFNAPNTAAPTPTRFSTENADVLKKLGATKVALVTTNSSATVLNQNQTAAGVDALKGIDVVYKNGDVPIGNSDWGAIAQSVKNSGADFLYFNGSPLDAAALATAVKQAGANLKGELFPGAYDSRVVGFAGLDQAYTVTDVKPFELNPPELANFKKYLEQVSPGQVLSVVTTPGWYAGDLFVQGIKDAGVNCPTQKAFISNLRMEKAWDAGGWFEPVSLMERFGQPPACWYVSQLVNKAWTPSLGGQRVCASKQLDNNKVVPTTTTTAAAAATATTAH